MPESPEPIDAGATYRLLQAEALLREAGFIPDPDGGDGWVPDPATTGRLK
jgi:hypothetical protein